MWVQGLLVDGVGGPRGRASKNDAYCFSHCSPCKGLAVANPTLRAHKMHTEAYLWYEGYGVVGTEHRKRAQNELMWAVKDEVQTWAKFMSLLRSRRTNSEPRSLARGYRSRKVRNKVSLCAPFYKSSAKSNASRRSSKRKFAKERPEFLPAESSKAKPADISISDSNGFGEHERTTNGGHSIQLTQLKQRQGMH
ncbi:hypothetical protein Ancab_013190 [Ancistrocladus abbreviatus]